MMLGKITITLHHQVKVMHKVLLRWPQETARMVFVKLISSLMGVAVGGYEWRWVWIEYG
jgi:hypothetical protein